MIQLYDAAGVLFPLIDPEDLLSRVVSVCWHQYGGSGLNISWSEAWELEWDELTMVLEEVERRRTAEANALRNARSTGAR